MPLNYSSNHDNDISIKENNNNSNKKLTKRDLINKILNH